MLAAQHSSAFAEVSECTAGQQLQWHGRRGGCTISHLLFFVSLGHSDPKLPCSPLETMWPQAEFTNSLSLVTAERVIWCSAPVPSTLSLTLWSVNDLAEACFGRVVEDKGLHQLVLVAAVDESVEHGIDATVYQQQALCGMQCCEESPLQLAGEGEVVKDGDVQQHHHFIGEPAHQETIMKKKMISSYSASPGCPTPRWLW